MRKANEAKVEGIELISFPALWFIVAGFVLGFTLSTLWEWLYYRRKRQELLQRYRATALADDERSPKEIVNRDSFDTDIRKMPSYRSSGVLLESETHAPFAEKPATEVEEDVWSQPRPLDATQRSEHVEQSDGAAARPLTVAALTAQTIAPADEPAAAAPDTQPKPVERLASTADKAGESAVMPPTAIKRSLVQEEQESLGNPAALARAGALAAASLGSSSGGHGRPAASAVNATPAAQGTPASTADHTRIQADATPPHAATAATVAAKSAEQESATTAPPADQPTRTVATHGFAQQTPQPSAATGTPAATTSPAPRPATAFLRHRPADYPDDLAMIKGIGEAYKRRLYATGIYTWRQLADTDTDSLRRITRAKPNADIASWLTQAMALAEKHDRMGANFTGPLDDFTRIEGIGAITADILYKAGICTYEALAGALPDELARIVPAPTVGNENDFDGWINDAARLAGAKRRNNGMLP